MAFELNDVELQLLKKIVLKINMANFDDTFDENNSDNLNHIVENFISKLYGDTDFSGDMIVKSIIDELGRYSGVEFILDIMIKFLKENFDKNEIIDFASRIIKECI